MSREANPLEWLRYAEDDRESAHLLFAGKKYEGCAFHCQQAVEKLLKGIIVKQTGAKPPHTHDLNALTRKIALVEIPEELAHIISNVDSYYIGARYPMEVIDPDTFIKPLAQKALQQMDEVFEWFLSRMNFKNE